MARWAGESAIDDQDLVPYVIRNLFVRVCIRDGNFRRVGISGLSLMLKSTLWMSLDGMARTLRQQEMSFKERKELTGLEAHWNIWWMRRLSLMVPTQQS